MKKENDDRQAPGYRFAIMKRLNVAMRRKNILSKGARKGWFPFLFTIIYEEPPGSRDHLSKSPANAMKSLSFI